MSDSDCKEGENKHSCERSDFKCETIDFKKHVFRTKLSKFDRGLLGAVFATVILTLITANITVLQNQEITIKADRNYKAVFAFFTTWVESEIANSRSALVWFPVVFAEMAENLEKISDELGIVIDPEDRVGINNTHVRIGEQYFPIQIRNTTHIALQLENVTSQVQDGDINLTEEVKK